MRQFVRAVRGVLGLRPVSLPGTVLFLRQPMRVLRPVHLCPADVLHRARLSGRDAVVSLVRRPLLTGEAGVRGAAPATAGSAAGETRVRRGCAGDQARRD